VQEERRAATTSYVEYLRNHGFNAELEEVEYVTGRKGLGWVEVTLIYIGLRADGLER
jgi:hypothetical protein